MSQSATNNNKTDRTFEETMEIIRQNKSPTSYILYNVQFQSEAWIIGTLRRIKMKGDRRNITSFFKSSPRLK